MFKADLHIHTKYSIDCNTSLEDVIARCQKLGINCVAISDHNTAEGALRMQEIAPFKVIVAEEILTPHGEVMGMFLKKTIPGGVSVEEAIALIKEQGGLVNIPHPCDTFRASAMPEEMLKRIADQIDIVEVFNARTFLKRTSAKARVFAEKHDLPGTAGSDAHTAGEIGNAYIEIPQFKGKKDFLAALRQGKIAGHSTSPFAHVYSLLAMFKSTLKMEG